MVNLVLARLTICFLLVTCTLGVLYYDQDCDPEVDFDAVDKQCASGRGLKCNRKTNKCYCLHNMHVWDPAAELGEMMPDWVTRTGEDPSKKGACKGDQGAFCSTIKDDCKSGLVCAPPHKGDPSICQLPL